MYCPVAQKKVLVLNKLWTPVGIATVRKSISLLFSVDEKGTPKATIVVPQEKFAQYTWDDWAKLKPADDEDAIKSVNQNFRIPKVILLSNYSKMPQERVHFNRKALYKRDNYTCQYCGGRPGLEELSVDHIDPRCQGGKTTWTNCVIACVPCNKKKAGRNLKECGFKLRKQPVKPRFSIYDGDIRSMPQEWTTWFKDLISEAYWNTELENDM